MRLLQPASRLAPSSVLVCGLIDRSPPRARLPTSSKRSSLQLAVPQYPPLLARSLAMSMPMRFVYSAEQCVPASVARADDRSRGYICAPSPTPEEIEAEKHFKKEQKLMKAAQAREDFREQSMTASVTAHGHRPAPRRLHGRPRRWCVHAAQPPAAGSTTMLAADRMRWPAASIVDRMRWPAASIVV